MAPLCSLLTPLAAEVVLQPRETGHAVRVKFDLFQLLRAVKITTTKNQNITFFTVVQVLQRRSFEVDFRSTSVAQISENCGFGRIL